MKLIFIDILQNSLDYMMCNIVKAKIVTFTLLLCSSDSSRET